MAEEEDQTETPSGKRLRQAWDEGRIPLGRDAVAVAGVAGAVGALVVLGGPMRTGLVRAVRQAVGALDVTPFSTLPHLVAIPVGAAAAAGTLVTLAQTRGGTWLHLAFPDLARVVRGGRIASAFSRRALLDLALAAAKVLALGWAAWTSVRADFLTLPGLLGATAPDQLSRMLSICLHAGSRMLLVAVLLAGADVAVTRRRFMKSMRVSRQDARREAREEEGDPLMRGKRKSRHRELSRGRARVEVPRADALLVNPTHVAIALRYRRDEGRAPRVTAKGKGALAEYMRQLARESAIPIVQDIPLARLLYRKVKVGREVPASTYKAVAAVLAFVYRLTGRHPGAREVTP